MREQIGGGPRPGKKIERLKRAWERRKMHRVWSFGRSRKERYEHWLEGQQRVLIKDKGIKTLRRRNHPAPAHRREISESFI